MISRIRNVQKIAMKGKRNSKKSDLINPLEKEESIVHYRSECKIHDTSVERLKQSKRV